MVEQDDAHGQDDDRGHGAVKQGGRVKRAGAKKGVAERLDQGGHGVGQHEPAVFFRHLGEGQDDRRGIHGQLHAKGDEHLQIAVADGERGDDDARSQSERRHDEHQHRREQHQGVGMDRKAPGVVIRQEAQKQRELNAELDDVGHDHGDRHAQARKIDFAKDGGVVDEGAGGAVEAFGEIVPAGDASHVEEHRRQVVRGQPGYPPKDDSEQQCGEQRLNDMPERAENGLLVLRHEIAPDKEHGQVAIAPQVGQVQVKPAGLGADDEGPGLGRGRRSEIGDRRSEVGHTKKIKS